MIKMLRAGVSIYPESITPLKLFAAAVIASRILIIGVTLYNLGNHMQYIVNILR